MLGSLNRIPGLKRLREHEAVHHLSMAVRSVLAGSSQKQGAAGPQDAMPNAPAPAPVVPPRDEELIRTWSSPEFIDSIRPCLSATRLDLDALFLLRQLAQAATAVPGDFLEFGTTRGGTAWLLASALTAEGKARRLHLLGEFAVRSACPVDTAGASSVLSEVKELLGETDVSYYAGEGSYGERFAQAGAGPYALAHLYCDSAAAVSECCELVYSKMSAGGFLVFENYGARSHASVAQAIDEFFADKPEQLVRLTSAQAVVCVLPRVADATPEPLVPPAPPPARPKARATPKRKSR